jgi:RNA polymerase sigma-70 factor (ECF subfamily)
MATQSLERFEFKYERDERLRMLLSACANRDKAAFARLYENTSSKLFGILRRILNRDDVAQDCLQEVYLKIWNRAADYKPYAASPLTWMSSIARHQAIDQLRRHRHEVIEAEGKEMGEQVDLSGSPEAHTTASDDMNLLDRCLRRLGAEQRQVFVMAYFKGLSHTELAEQTAIPVGTIKTWIRRGLQSLKRCMEP